MLRWMIGVVLSGLMVCGSAHAFEPMVLKLWPKGLPEGAVRLDAAKVAKLKETNQYSRVTIVEEPAITVYPAPEPNGAAVVICPGGGYNILAWDKEGTEVAGWLHSLGVTGIVLKYRVPRRDLDAPEKEPLQDAQRAIRVVRQHAEEWGLDPERVGIMGFSAGGNLTVMAGTRWDEKTYPAQDEADELSCRPDFMIPIYPAYLGAPARDDQALNPNVQVNADTPPTFMTVAWDDKMRGLHAALLFAELKKAGVPAEVHVFSRGGHGYGLRPSDDPVSQWPRLCGDWLRVSGFLNEAGETEE